MNQIDLRLGHAGRVRAALVGERGRADHPADRPGGPRGRGAARPTTRSTTSSARSATAPSAASARWSPRSPRRWPRTSPSTWSRRASGPATCTPRSTPSSASASCGRCGSGEFDVLVGVNLLREGLDLPEVTLVAILDADKEGFLRGTTSLIQTIGRAARNVDGRVIMYADKRDRGHAHGDRRDQPAPRDPGRLQRGARHHAGVDQQGRLGHRRAAGPQRRARGAARRAAARWTRSPTWTPTSSSG